MLEIPSMLKGEFDMKIAALSDIHGNYIALQKCIDYALDKGVETFIFLGDYVGELAYPQKTMEIIYSLKEKYNCFFVKGNKEDYWLDYRAKRGGTNVILQQVLFIIHIVI